MSPATILSIQFPDYIDNGEYRCVGENKVFRTDKTNSSKTTVEATSEVTVQLTDTG